MRIDAPGRVIKRRGPTIHQMRLPLISERAGYSAVLMNLEHMAMSIENMKDIAVACLNVGYFAAHVSVKAKLMACSISPTVVVPTCSTEWISRCLDSGAQTIIVPHVNTVEQAKMCVDAAKFPPVVGVSLKEAFPFLQLMSLRRVIGQSQWSLQ